MTDETKPLGLIIEDSAEAAHIMQRAMEVNGYRVQVIYDGHEALDVLSKTQPQLVLLDLNLPYVSGFELIDRIREDERLADTKVIIVSANVLAEEDLAGKFDAVVAKPIMFSQLRDVIKDLS